MKAQGVETNSPGEPTPPLASAGSAVFGSAPASSMPAAAPSSRARAHHFVDRATGEVMDERLFGDRVVRFLYSTLREKAPALFRMLTSARMSRWLATLNFDAPLAANLLGNTRFLERAGVDLGECLDPPESFDTPRRIFERKIRYWECRPMPADEAAVVSPADARVVVGSLSDTSLLRLKGKFFDLEELLGPRAETFAPRFASGEYAVLRLTPDKYHYNHAPVSGTVVDVFEVPGGYHACNPSAVVEIVTPCSKNKRVVTLIQTDVPGGTRVGLVAMIEVVALMIGDVVQCYSRQRYDESRPVERGLFIEKGAPKSLYRPGSSTDVLLFEPGRVSFAPDIVANQKRDDVVSRYSTAFGQPVTETEVRVRSLLATRAASGVGLRA
jgi:phosphatidylserine decarboxylase